MGSRRGSELGRDPLVDVKRGVGERRRLRSGAAVGLSLVVALVALTATMSPASGRVMDLGALDGSGLQTQPVQIPEAVPEIPEEIVSTEVADELAVDPSTGNDLSTSGEADLQMDSPPAVPCPSEPPGSGPLDCIAIRFLNPATLSGAPKVSSKFDGVDETFSIVAVGANVPAGAVVRVFLARGNGEQLIGDMTPVPGSADTWEFKWSVPTALDTGSAELVVKALRGPQAGAEELSRDSVAVDLQHKDPPPPNPVEPSVGAAETSVFTWPAQNGPLGFYKPIGGEWRTVVDGILSTGADGQFAIHYSATPVGRDPEFVQCGSGTAAARESDDLRPFRAGCTLTGDHVPSSVTAIAILPRRTDPELVVLSSAEDQSPDARRVRPYVQRVEDMSISLEAVSPPSVTRAWPSSWRRVAGSGCLEVAAHVADQLGRPVQGANIDVELAGPANLAAFGNGTDMQVPAGFPEQDASNCSGGAAGTQGLFAIPDGPDAKRIESDAGTGTPFAATLFGEWRFLVFSPPEEFGSSRVVAWVDDQPRTSEHAHPEPDNELRDPHEPVDELELQWLEEEVSVVASPFAGPAPVDSCRRYAVTALGGGTRMGGVNVDIHVRGPEGIRFCRPPGASTLRQPDAGEHGTEEAPGGDTHPPETTHCAGEGHPCVHREGETNARGNLVFGLISATPGRTEITAWFDGEPGTDNDLNDLSGASVTFSTDWVRSVADAKMSFVNPSGFPGGAVVSTSPLRIVLAIDAPYLVGRVEVEIEGSEGGPSPLGRARRVGPGNVYELTWDLDSAPETSEEENGEEENGEEQASSFADGIYTLRARVPGTTLMTERSLTLRRADNPLLVDPPFEGIELVTPANGGAASIRQREIRLAGFATPGTNEIRFFYSTTPPGRDMSAPGAWSAAPCGTTTLPASGSGLQQFEGSCMIADAHRPEQVSAVAAVAYNCLPGNCLSLPQTGHGQQSGDAVSISACTGSPCMVVSPRDWQAPASTCQPLVAEVTSFESGAIAGADVDVRLRGRSPRFCGSSGHRGRHTVGRTDDAGRLTLGVAAARSSFDSIFSRAEDGVTTAVASIGERSDSATYHWKLSGRCTLIGTRRNDSLVASSFPSKICAVAGNNTILGLDGLEGHDIILGGSGNDVIRGQRGNDMIYGGPGKNRLLGGPGDDIIFAGRGRNAIDGGPGSDWCLISKRDTTVKNCKRVTLVDRKEARQLRRCFIVGDRVRTFNNCIRRIFG